MGSLAPHKFVKLTEVNPDFAELPKSDIFDGLFNYMLEVYTDNYIALAIPGSQDQLHHAANAIITGIHDVFPPYKDDKEDEISLKKILKMRPHGKLLRMCWDLNLMETHGGHTRWITEDCRTDILTKLKKWIREGEHRKKGILFEELRTYLAKLRNAFITIPSGKYYYLPATRCWERSRKYLLA